MILTAIARRFLALKGGKSEVEARLTHLESLAVAQVEAPGYEMTRAGRRFSLAYTGAVPTGIAPVQAFPTTAAQWVIWNADTYKSYIFRTLGALLFSGTAGTGGQLLACVFSTPVQTGFAAGIAVASHSFSAIGSKAAVKSGVTITAPGAPNWIPVAEDPGSGARVGPLGAIVNRQVEGRLIVPPGAGLGLAVLAPAGTTPLYLPVAEWEEAESDLE